MVVEGIVKTDAYDYIVVGAGSAGSIMASRLSERGDARVLLLDQGPPNTSWTVRIPGGLRENFKPNRPYMKWYQTTPQKHLDGRVVDHPRGIGLGGSSLVNGMVFLRGNALDYDSWAEQGAEGWAYKDVLPAFKRIENRAEGGNAFRGTGGPHGVRRQEKLNPLNQAFLDAGQQAGYAFTDDVNGRDQEGMCQFDMNVDHGFRSSSYYSFIEKRGKRANLTVKSGVVVGKLLFTGDRATGIEFAEKGRKTSANAEREVIVCCGAVGSPQLLLLSGIGPERDLRGVGIKTVHNLPGVGENLHDHLELDLQWECTQPITLNGQLRLDRMAVIGLEWLLFKKGIAAGNQCHVGGFVKSASETTQPNIQFHFFPACFDGWVPRKDMHGFRVSAGPMRQTSRGTLKLCSSDPLAPPILDPNYMSTEKDKRELYESYEVLQDVVAQKALDAYRGPALEPRVMPTKRPDIEKLVRDMAASSYHLCGTCKMGSETDDFAVVDPRGRVRGVRGLRVADASIMPSIISSNLNAPSMMIGEKVAEMVNRDRN